MGELRSEEVMDAVRCEDAAMAAAEGSSAESRGVLPSGMVCCMYVGEAFFGVELIQNAFLDPLRMSPVPEADWGGGAVETGEETPSCWLL